MTEIDPTARVASGAVIGADVSIGPFCVVGPNVEIADGCRLRAHVHVAGRTRIGPRVGIEPFTSLGGPPQSASYRGEDTRLIIGADCDIREGVTINIGTVQGGGVTTVGDRCMLMANTHIGHDCRIGNDVIFASGVALGGHCDIGDHVFVGGLAALHQHTCVGPHAMISGVTGVRGDVIPFAVAAGADARLTGINTVGMRRRNFAPEAIQAVRRAYRMLFFGNGSLQQRIDAVAHSFADDAAVAAIVGFMRSSRKRPLCQPRPLPRAKRE